MRPAPLSDTADAPPAGGGARGPDPLIGRFVGPYIVVRHLGSGGMGAVYLAEHPALNRKVAVKVLTADPAADPTAVERFRREARAAAALDHPHIVRLFDIGQTEDFHYLVLEYVEGTDLQTALDRDGPLPFAEAVAVVAQAAAGLQHAHERGFIHRDVKPANLIRTLDGTVKVLDMGLARSVQGDLPGDRLTQQLSGECIVGTADYLSPEQAMNAELDPRSDVYSLGATLYALLRGRPPFGGSTVQKLTQVQFKEPPRLDREPGRAVPPELADLVSRMLAKRPKDRFQSAAEVIAALSPWLPADLLAALGSDAHTRKSLSEVMRKARRRSRRRWTGWLALAAVAVLGGAVLAVRPWAGSGGEPVRPEPPARVADLDAHLAKANDLVFSPDGTKLASIDTSGQLVIWDTASGRPLHKPAREGPKACCWVCAGTSSGYVLTAGESQPIVAYDWGTGAKVREYTPHAAHVTGLAPSPDGRFLAVSGSSGEVAVLDLASGAEVRRLPVGAGLVWAVAYSADGSRLAAGSAGGGTPETSNRVIVWRASDGKELLRFVGHENDVRTVAFRRDGRVLASGGFDGTVRLWNLETGAPVRNWAAHDGYVERVLFLSDGKRLVTCGGPGPGLDAQGERGAVKIWDADTGAELRAWRGPGWRGLISLAVSKDERLLAAGARDGIIRLWPVTLDP